MSGGYGEVSNGAMSKNETRTDGMVRIEGAEYDQLKAGQLYNCHPAVAEQAGCPCVECRSVKSETLAALRKKSPDKSMNGSGPLTPAQRAKLVHNALGEFGPWSSRYNGRYRFPGGAEAATGAVAAAAIPRQTTPAAAH